jgi:hypothetical protein
MTFNVRNIVKAGRIAAVAGFAGAVLICGGVALAQSNRSASPHGIHGAWSVVVTLRNCDTNAPLGSFRSLVTFHDGGTLSETASTAGFAIGQRSPGHGSWQSEGRGEYTQRMINLINFDTPANLPGTVGFDPSLPITPGFFAGWSIVTHTVEMVDRNHLTSSGGNEFFKADGTLYRSGCSTTTAIRFE